MSYASPAAAVPPPNVPLLAVRTPSGQSIEVLGAAEESFYRTQAAKYTAEFAFTNASDLLDLDRLLFLELMVYRATNWLGSEKNYHGELVSPSEQTSLRRLLKENSGLISQIKNDLGMTKNQRDKAQYESVGTYLVQLRQRAREHGIKREKELKKALELIHDLFAIVGAYDRADEIERRKLGFESPEEILDWVRNVMRPEYDRIDEHFRTHQQKFWVREI